MKEIIMQMFQIQPSDNWPYVARFGNRKTLAELFNVLGFKIGAEIGVWKGEYSEVLCKAIPDLKLYCVDPWAPFKQNMRSAGSPRMAEERWETTHKRLALYPNVEYKRMISLEAVKDFENGSLDFVYIDALHGFDDVMRDIINWVPKVRKGGIVAGHDYFYHPEVGVVQAVNAYTHAHHICDYFITNDHSECQSFFWEVE